MPRLPILLALAVVGISITATLRPETFRFVQSLPGRDKLGHFLLMGLLSAVVVYGCADLRVRGRRVGLAGSIAAVLLFVTAEELSQLGASSRSFSLIDLAWSAGGVVVLGSLAEAAARWRRRRRGRRCGPPVEVRPPQ